jgi:hypothetical protein
MERVGGGEVETQGRGDREPNWTGAFTWKAGLAGARTRLLGFVWRRGLTTEAQSHGEETTRLINGIERTRSSQRSAFSIQILRRAAYLYG